MSNFIEIYWAKTHNLKNISINIPKNKLIVITGVSWSGKSSLAFDTIYAEWQKKYLESLSTYARMVISDINNDTKVDEIKWLSPTISINQKTTTSNPRSTVWTITEIYDFYRLLYVSIWEQKCPNHKDIILQKHAIQDVLDYIFKLKDWNKIYILFQLEDIKDINELKNKVLSLWFIRFIINNNIYSIWDDIKYKIQKIDKIYIVVDRFLSEKKYINEQIQKIKDSLSLAYKKGEWKLIIYNEDLLKFQTFTQNATCPKCFYNIKELTISNFSFNSHFWACDNCHWLWYKMVFLEENLINFKLSLAEWAILPWNWSSYYTQILKAACEKHKINFNKKYQNLTQQEKNLILYWSWEIFDIEYTFEDWQKKYLKVRYEWIIPNLERKYKESDKLNEQYLKKLSQYIKSSICEKCLWLRLKNEFLNIFVWWKNIWELSNLSIEDSLIFFKNLKLSPQQKEISENVLKNIIERLQFLSNVWVWYIKISRNANTLSWWEHQRIRLATQIWTKLEGIIYVLDEPSIWLHSKDNKKLINNLKELVNIWNTVIVVEHDEEIMKESDYIIDIGPKAWIYWWEVIFKWTVTEMIKNNFTETGQYLSNKKKVFLEKKERPIKNYLEIINAWENNLKNISVKIPLGVFTVITWVSWSGKSSLILNILSRYLLKHFWINNIDSIWKHKEILWVQNLDKAIIINQSPIWKTPHSNIATYTWVFTYIREVFANSQDAKKRWYNQWHFSFNTKWWRCEICEGSWFKKIEMYFLPNMYVECEKCFWTRYNKETLEIKYKWKNIADILSLSVEEATDFFKAYPKIFKILDILNKVWLGYIKLWQPAPTLSWWESQRIKLATELAKRSTTKTIYILDEPTTGLHFSDIQKLLNILDSLVEKWNTVLVIEHNLNVIINADYIIDLWPDWWDFWWEIICAWRIKNIINNKKSYTMQELKKFISYLNKAN